MDPLQAGLTGTQNRGGKVTGSTIKGKGLLATRTSIRVDELRREGPAACIQTVARWPHLAVSGTGDHAALCKEDLPLLLRSPGRSLLTLSMSMSMPLSLQASPATS
jgi:hypothetical protein